MLWRGCIALVCWACWGLVARADLPSIRFDRLTPVGGSAGTTVEAEILGGDIEDLKTLFFDHPGITAELIKDRKFQIKIAQDVPAGTYDARLVGRFGVSNPRLFAVTQGLTDITEKEPNNEPKEAQEVTLNSALNGQSDGNGEDFFAVTLKAGQPFYEAPTDLHAVSRNASASAPARFLVVFVKDAGKPVLEPAH